MRARSWHREYIRSIVDRDVRDVARIKDADDVARLLKLLAIRTGELQNTSGLANELKLSNITVDKYLTVLERLFLIRRLPSWQKNHANRLIKAPKIHLVDSGLSATLAGLDADSWRDDRSRMGHLLKASLSNKLSRKLAGQMKTCSTSIIEIKTNWKLTLSSLKERKPGV